MFHNFSEKKTQIFSLHKNSRFTKDYQKCAMQKPSLPQTTCLFCSIPNCLYSTDNKSFATFPLVPTHHHSTKYSLRIFYQQYQSRVDHFYYQLGPLLSSVPSQVKSQLSTIVFMLMLWFTRELMSLTSHNSQEFLKTQTIHQNQNFFKNQKVSCMQTMNWLFCNFFANVSKMQIQHDSNILQIKLVFFWRGLNCFHVL